MESQTIEVEIKPVQISRIHFLIHPGYISDIDPEASESKKKWALGLLGNYTKMAECMREDELMVAFTHTSFNDLRRDILNDKAYAATLIVMKNLLGKRMIVVTAAGDDFFHKPGHMQKVINIIKKRNFAFSTEDVDTVAYGEYASDCVQDGAENLNRSAGFKKKTVIIPQLTDHAVTKSPISWYNEQFIKQKNTHIIFGTLDDTSQSIRVEDD